VLTKHEKNKAWEERIKNDEEHARLYEILLLVGKDEFEKMIKEYLQDEINKIGIEENVNQN